MRRTVIYTEYVLNGNYSNLKETIIYIPYTRSSSLSNYSFCEFQYFLTYNLGFQSKSNTKANKGTTAHKVFESLAIGKQYLQNNPDSSKLIIEDDALGKLEYETKDFFQVTELSLRDINTINKSRINKSTYMYDCLVPESHLRVGISVVEDLIDRATKYYSKYEDSGDFTAIDKKDIANFSWIPLELFSREYDPRNRNIFCPEKPFEIEIDAEWAYYNFVLKDAEIYGAYRIKGTIDLITQIDDDTLEIVDWKTGARKDWGSGKVKDYEYLMSDKQLLLYYYAARKCFPQFKNIIITIMFIRDGGPYTLCFEDSDMIRAEKMLEKHFKEVSSNSKPRPVDVTQKDFKCNRLCHFYKNSLPNTKDNICKHIQKELYNKGIEKVIDEYIQPGFTLDKYHSPGA